MNITTTTKAWLRVNRHNPCAICGKPDWCSFASTGDAAICMHVMEGSIRTVKNGGYLHRLHHGQSPFQVALSAPPAAEPPKRNDLHLVSRQYETALSLRRLTLFARSLGVSEDSLCRLNIGWSYEFGGVFTFPMRDAGMRVIGIRVRRQNGRKFALPGSREGLFIPHTLTVYTKPNKPAVTLSRLFICEGASDTAALDDMGFEVVGRPSCRGGVRLLVDLVKLHDPQQVVIVADADAPGQVGARDLARVLGVYCADVVIITPPTKDIREWLLVGATAQDVEHLIENADADIAADDGAAALLNMAAQVEEGGSLLETWNNWQPSRSCRRRSPAPCWLCCLKKTMQPREFAAWLRDRASAREGVPCG